MFVFHPVGFDSVMKMMVVMGHNDDEDKNVNIQ